MNTIDIIRAEIERLIEESDFDESANLYSLLSFLSTLEESKKCDGCNNVKGCVTCVNGDQWAHYEESEKPVPTDLDFEQELYKHFGQVKDFTLGMRIAKYFYELGRSEKPNNHLEGLDVTNFCQPIHPDIAKILPDVINELTWGEDKKPVEGLDEAAGLWIAGVFLAYSVPDTLVNLELREIAEKSFKAGAEWAMRQGEPVDVLSKMTPCAKERYKLLVRIAEDVWGYKLTRNKSYDDTRIRMFVSFRMKREGYPVSDIGKAMGRHHASIINQVRKMENVFDEPVFYAEEYAKYAMFEDIINKYDGERNEDNLAGD